jgi:competence protein ComEC
LDKTIAVAAAAVAAVALIIVAHPFSAPRSDERLHVDFLDVGQGDSALVTFPNGQTMLVDGGGRLEFRSDDEAGEEVFEPDRQGVGEAVVSPVLWQKGYSHIDYILATHADADHIQGLTDVAKNFSVGEALFGRMPAADPEFQELAAVLRDRGIRSGYVSRGQQLKFGGATVEVLYPRADRGTDAPSDNNHSVILRIVYGSRAFLLTGDVEREGENELVTGGGNLRADVIKVPHHGSRTSSTQEFVDSVGARYAVISVGRHSRFGHPHREVVDRWRATGATVITTGERGMVSVSTDGSDLNIFTYEK